MLQQNRMVAARANISSWHAASYTGRSIRIAVLDPERFLYNYQAGAIQRPLGESGKAGGHLGQCCAVLQQIAPEAELFALGTDRAAWEWVLANDIDIVSCSYAAGAINAALLPRLEQSNLITLAAAGNGSNLETGADRAYPSCYDWTVSVGAYCPNLNQLEPYTNGGEALDCVAYTDFAVLNNQGKVIAFTGTSCATAVAAGMMALVLQKEGRKKGWRWAREYIKQHSKELLEPGKDLASGYGLFSLPEVEEGTVEIRMKIGRKLPI